MLTLEDENGSDYNTIQRRSLQEWMIWRSQN